MAASSSPEKLTVLQDFLAEVLRSPTPLVDDAAMVAACAKHATGNDRLTPAEQVDIYRRQFWLRHVDSLIEDYPGLLWLLGDDAFEEFARAYLIAHPPRHPSLRDLGADIVPFSATYEAFPSDRVALCREMVAYENAFVDLFDGADVPPLDPQKLTAMSPEDWDTARVVLHPLLARFRLEYPVHLGRSAAKRGEPLPRVPSPSSTHVVLYRRELLVRFEELEPAAFDLLDALARGKSLVAACDDVVAVHGEDGLQEKVGAWFQSWTALGWIVDVAR
jgi:hypothetical protein